MRGKIFYDKVIRTRNEWEKELFSLLKGFPDINMPYLGDLPELEAIQSHYFAILNNQPQKIREWIRNQVKEKLGAFSPIVLDFVLAPRKNSEFYRIDVPKDIGDIYRKPIYDVQSRWIKDKTLHSKGAEAIRNLMEKLESGEL